MKRHVSLAALAVGLVLIAAAPRGAAGLSSTVERAIAQVSAGELRQHVAALAGDAMQGRGLGEPGNREAERYAADALRRAAVAAANGDSYFQAVEIYEPALGSDARLRVTAAGAAVADLGLGRDFYPLPESADLPVTGPLVFAGHGISAPAWRHDDYAKVDARGAIVLVEAGAPTPLLSRVTLSDDEKIDAASIDRKIADARAHGAAGLVIVRSRLDGAEAVWPERGSRQAASYRLFEAMRAAPLAVATIAERAAAPLRRAVSAGATSATLTPGIAVRRLTMHNVLGTIQGHDARGDLVVLGAHLDHDGLDESGEIFNGADDNASGTAAVLALAGAFARAAAEGERPRRTLVFALWNGEEKGSLGSSFYADAPAPPRRIAANINLDMIGRSEEADPAQSRFRGLPRTSRADSANVVHLLGYSYAPDLARLVRRANEAVKLEVKEEYDSGAQRLVRRSDNWPFLERGIPAIFLTTGLHPDYHTPADDVERIDFGKLERIAELAGRVTWMAADGPALRMKIK